MPEALRDEFRFTQGQYLTLRTLIDGQPPARSYPICSGVDDDELSVAIKRVEGGAFSNFANDMFKVGEYVEVKPPQGNFFTRLDPAARRNYLLIAAGSGITPILSHLKTILAREPHSKVTLIHGNRSSNSILFREQLSFLKNRYLTRFQWINILSREDQGSDLLNGHIDNRKGAELNRRLIHLRGFDEFFLCGPESMMSEVSRGLRAFGVGEQHIHYELFASSAADAQAVLAKHEARVRERGGQMSRITVEEVLVEFRNRRPQRAGSLIVTVFGDAISQHGNSVWLGSLIAALEPFGLNDRMIRTSVFRLAQDGWLQATQVGRRSYYSFTESGLRHYEKAARRIYAAQRPEWNGEWTWYCRPC